MKRMQRTAYTKIINNTKNADTINIKFKYEIFIQEPFGIHLFTYKHCKINT